MTGGAEAMAVANAVKTGWPILRDILSWFKVHRFFHATPIPQRSTWNSAKQPDGRIITFINIHLYVRNLTDVPITILRAELLEPKISGQLIQEIVYTKAPFQNVFGSAYSIHPHDTKEAHIIIESYGEPKKKDGIIYSKIKISDDIGNTQCIKLQLRNPGWKQF